MTDADARAIRIDDLELSARSARLLRRGTNAVAGIDVPRETLGDVIDWCVRENKNLFHIRQFGLGSLRDVVGELRALGVPEDLITILRGPFDAKPRRLEVKTVSSAPTELITFFYLLVRDALPAGEVIRIVREARRSRCKEAVFTSAPIEALARGALKELLNP